LVSQFANTIIVGHTGPVGIVRALASSSGATIFSLFHKMMESDDDLKQAYPDQTRLWSYNNDAFYL
jgi:hypothetical protein